MCGGPGPYRTCADVLWPLDRQTSSEEGSPLVQVPVEGQALPVAAADRVPFGEPPMPDSVTPSEHPSVLQRVLVPKPTLAIEDVFTRNSSWRSSLLVRLQGMCGAWQRQRRHLER